MPYRMQHDQADRDWPCDFDIRSFHSEQQELLAEGDAASTSVQDQNDNA